MPTEPTPVYILTGFLGSGKTSFLNHWIQSQPKERFMVIENEIGAVNLDSQWIVGTDITPVPLTAGCLCCSLNAELIDVLETLSSQRDSFDVLVIETTGMADPETIALPFLSSKRIGQHFQLKAILCLVDAGNFVHWLGKANEARRQVTFANSFLVNKIDTVDQEQLSKLLQELKEINPQAEVQMGVNGCFPVEALKEIDAFRGSNVVEQFKKTPPSNQLVNHGITTCTLSFDRPFDVRALSQALMEFLSQRHDQIYRIKGILNAPDYHKQLILQSVASSFILTDGNQWPTDKIRESKIVLIGKKLQKKELEGFFEGYLT